MNQILADAGFPVEVAIIALVTIIGIAGIVAILRRRTSRQPLGFKEILRRHDLPEVVPYLTELASHVDRNLRYSTAVSLASYPSSSTLELISALMVDPEEHVRSGIYIGLSHAIRENRLTPDLRRSITGLLSEVVVKESEATFL